MVLQTAKVLCQWQFCKLWCVCRYTASKQLQLCRTWLYYIFTHVNHPRSNTPIIFLFYFIAGHAPVFALIFRLHRCAAAVAHTHTHIHMTHRRLSVTALCSYIFTCLFAVLSFLVFVAILRGSARTVLPGDLYPSNIPRNVVIMNWKGSWKVAEARTTLLTRQSAWEVQSWLLYCLAVVLSRDIGGNCE